jgi:hypothetical protein
MAPYPRYAAVGSVRAIVHKDSLLRPSHMPYRGEGNWIEGVTMNLVLIILQVAVLLTLVFAYGRK